MVLYRHALWLFTAAFLLVLPQGALAEQRIEQNTSKTLTEAPRSAFGRGFNVTNIFRPSLAKFQAPKTAVVNISETKSETKKEEKRASLPSKPVFVSKNPGEHILPPSEDPRVRINPEAPGPFVAMASAYQEGDLSVASDYADQYVRYQVNLMFETRALTQLIGEALIRQGLIDEESWVGAEQLMSLANADVREGLNTPIRPTHELVLKQIKSDPAHKAEIYFFFTPSSRHSRQMASDVERLWRVVKGDKNLKLISLTAGSFPKDLVHSFREYTGMTMPILDGTAAAKSFRVAFVPAIVVLSPGQNISYVRTGEMSFSHMYEFVRAVQGLPTRMPQDVKRLMAMPVSETEVRVASGKAFPWEMKLASDFIPRTKYRTRKKTVVLAKDSLGRF